VDQLLHERFWIQPNRPPQQRVQILERDRQGVAQVNRRQSLKSRRPIALVADPFEIRIQVVCENIQTIAGFQYFFSLARPGEPPLYWGVSDPRQFVDELRRAVERYLRTIDAWEEAFQKYYRLASTSARLSVDLEPFQADYNAARAELKNLIPRARQLSRRFDLPDPWPGVLHVRLGARAPQTGAAPAYGQGERTVIYRCLDSLDARLRVPDDVKDEPARPSESRGVLGRVLDYFF
jgi:hypothetical protein